LNLALVRLLTTITMSTSPGSAVENTKSADGDVDGRLIRELGVRLFRAATRVSQDLSVRDAQDILAAACGFRLTMPELFVQLGYPPSDRVSAVSLDEFIALLLSTVYVSPVFESGGEAAVRAATAHIATRDDPHVAMFKVGASAEAFVQGAWTDCVVQGYDAQTYTTRVSYKGDDGRAAVACMPHALLRCVIAEGTAVEAMDATGRWWPASVVHLYDDDEVDLLVYSGFDTFEVAGALRSAVRVPQQLQGGRLARPFALGDRVFVPGSLMAGAVTAAAASGAGNSKQQQPRRGSLPR
jgi:hypothetical protein